MDDDTMPAGKMFGCGPLIKQPNPLVFTVRLPAVGQKIGLLLKGFGVGEKEQPPSMLQSPAGFDHASHPFGIRGDGQDPETLDAKFTAVNVLRPGRLIGEQLPVNAGLVKIAARDWHGGPVGFQEIPASLVAQFQTEYAVGNDAAFVADVHIPLKWLAQFWKVQIFG